MSFKLQSQQLLQSYSKGKLKPNRLKLSDKDVEEPKGPETNDSNTANNDPPEPEMGPQD